MRGAFERSFKALLSTRLGDLAPASLPRYPVGMAGRYRDNGEGAISRRKDGRWVARYHTRTANGPKRKALYATSRSEEAAVPPARAIAERDGSGPITIGRSVSTDYGVVWGPTRTDEERVIGIPERVVDASRRHRKAQIEERASSWEDPSLIFPNTRGGIWRHQGMSVTLTGACDGRTAEGGPLPRSSACRRNVDAREPGAGQRRLQGPSARGPCHDAEAIRPA